MNKTTYIACPTHNGEIQGDIVGAIIDATQSRVGPIAFSHHKFSKLTQNFNMTLCDAINRGYTHFMMIHGDILPEQGWFKKMHEVMEEFGADILSVVSPIKNPKGLTSTGLCEKEEVPLRIKRFTLKEIRGFDETFTHEHLIINTGLMLVNLKAKFVDYVGKGLEFRVTDNILKNAQGKLKAFGASEDWLFSLDARKYGAKIYATSAVKLHHIGGHKFNNFDDYGIDSEEWGLS